MNRLVLLRILLTGKVVERVVEWIGIERAA